jgi:hypothetical protein
VKAMKAELARIRKAVSRALPDTRIFVVELCPVPDAPPGFPVGLYRVGSPGSSAGVYVYDPAAGEPVLPADKVTPHTLVIGGEVRPHPDDWATARPA